MVVLSSRAAAGMLSTCRSVQNAFIPASHLTVQSHWTHTKNLPFFQNDFADHREPVMQTLTRCAERMSSIRAFLHRGLWHHCPVLMASSTGGSPYTSWGSSATSFTAHFVRACAILRRQLRALSHVLGALSTVYHMPHCQVFARISDEALRARGDRRASGRMGATRAPLAVHVLAVACTRFVTGTAAIVGALANARSAQVRRHCIALAGRLSMRQAVLAGGTDISRTSAGAVGMQTRVR